MYEVAADVLRSPSSLVSERFPCCLVIRTSSSSFAVSRSMIEPEDAGCTAHSTGTTS